MKLKITTTYNHYTTPDNDKMICKFYLINNIPFTFDVLPKISQDDPAVIALPILAIGILPNLYLRLQIT